ncbi:hypothetical protein J2Y67_003808 [Neobacillus niacini]|nr:hypothetical protein [Neobacillus niacini]
MTKKSCGISSINFVHEAYCMPLKKFFYYFLILQVKGWYKYQIIF